MNGKIGLAIITHKRPEYFKRSFATVPTHAIDDFIVVNDGTPYDFEIVNLIQNAIPLGVGASKKLHSGIYLKIATTTFSLWRTIFSLRASLCSTSIFM